MTVEEFKKIGERWAQIDNDYDNAIQRFFDNPEKKPNDEELAKLKTMQQELWDLESKWYEFANQ